MIKQRYQVKETLVEQGEKHIHQRKPHENSLVKAQSLIFENFLLKKELAALLKYTLSREADFLSSLVEYQGPDEEAVSHKYRRSRVLYDLGSYRNLIIAPISNRLPEVLEKLSHPSFPVSSIEAEITASNDGDFFRRHSDNTEEPIREREISYVYYFHREPKGFTGGQLRIYDSRFENGRYVAADSFKTIFPRQNRIVFFPSSLVHELSPVHCRSRSFADSRFTLNGWVRKKNS
jgi:SM-20-related protein